MNNAQTILLVDDDPAIRDMTKRILHGGGYTLLEAATGLDGLTLAREHRPGMVLLDVDLPDVDGMEVCKQLKNDPACAETFVVMLSNSVIDTDSQARGIEIGADGYIARPIGNRELLARIHALFRIRAAETALHVKAQQQTMIAELAQFGLANMQVDELMQQVVSRSALALQADRSHILRPQCDSTELVMAAAFGWPGCRSGQPITSSRFTEQVCQALDTQHAFVCSYLSSDDCFTVTDSAESSTGCGMFVAIQGQQTPYGILGVHAGRPDAFSQEDEQHLQSVANILSLAIMRTQAEENLQYVAMHDGLTGLYNRMYYEEELARLQASRLYPISFLLIDVDALKYANDHFGHAVGDLMLKSVSQALRAACRVEDMVARIGGDEFAMLLPRADNAIAEEKKRLIHRALEERQQHLPAGCPLSVSVGHATATVPGELEQMKQRADELMYQEKTEHHAAERV